MEIEMSFQNDTSLEKYDKAYFYHIAEVLFKHLNLDGYFIFEINIVNIDEIHRINKEYRHIDRPTDVISFAFEDDYEGETKIIKSSSLPRDLGEIFICKEVMEKQAEDYGHSQDREISFLTCHGLLHLLGYDHMSEDEEKEMFKIQDEIMEILGL